VADKLHIVCLDAPSPPDYGGAIDMHYKIKALANAGVAITLHYFDYKAGRNADDLRQYCTNIFSYSRKTFLRAPTFSKPHIVASRINQPLIERLNADSNPVLLEGVHCTGIIPFLKTRKRNILVRLHNDEATYYRHLAKAEGNFFKSSYYHIESLLLKRHQKNLPSGVSYAALSEKDKAVFKIGYGMENVFVVPPFVPWNEITSMAGNGTFCLYHGNLSVSENEAAALWLVENVFSQTTVPFVIAGNTNSARLEKAAKPFRHINVKSNPATQELEELIRQAHIHVLPDFNNTGIKLKLLHALFCGRFCITNNAELTGCDTVALAQTPQHYMGFLKSFMDQEFTAAHIEERTEALRLYDNKQSAELLTTRLC
jgi:hypothetical protein